MHREMMALVMLVLVWRYFLGGGIAVFEVQGCAGIRMR
jgi:hypothetical protein